MAIQNDISESTSDFGIQFNNAYYRIMGASVTRQLGIEPKFSVSIDICAYATSSPIHSTKEVDVKRYFVPLDDINAASGSAYLEKCYSWLMAQADFEGSTAV